jgi:hypothetical protein
MYLDPTTASRVATTTTTATATATAKKEATMPAELAASHAWQVHLAAQHCSAILMMANRFGGAFLSNSDLYYTTTTTSLLQYYYTYELSHDMH